MRGYLYGSKDSIASIVSGICAYRCMSFSSCRSRVLDGYRDGSSHGGDYPHLCDLLYGGWISGWKDCQAGEISLGSSVGACLFPAVGNSFVYREQKLGYERSAYDNNLLHVPWRRYAWRNAVLIKKCFYLSRIYAILCPEHYT